MRQEHSSAIPPTDWLGKWVASITDYSICAISLEGRVLTWNPGGEVIHGYRPDEVIGQPIGDFYTQGDRHRGLPATGLERARQVGRHDTEGWRVRKDGTVFWASELLTALYAQDGQIDGFARIVRDMIDSKRAHDAVLESERRFRMLVDGVTDYAIFMLSPDGAVTNWNSGAQRIKGYAAQEIIGSHFALLHARGCRCRVASARFGSGGARWALRRRGMARQKRRYALLGAGRHQCDCSQTRREHDACE